MASPFQPHLDVSFQVIKYLKGTTSQGLFYLTFTNLSLSAYCDVDWASCTFFCRSLTRFCIFLGGALVLWKTKKQSTISRSFAKAKYHSMASTMCELIWISNILKDINVQFPLPIPLRYDNKVALHIIVNFVFQDGTKHLDIDNCHLTRDYLKQGFIAWTFVSSSLQLAYMFTKPFSAAQHHSMSVKLGLCTPKSPT